MGRHDRRGNIHPRPTLVLLVRHGQTATTGRELPGRRRGLHLSDAGRRQAEAVAKRIGRLSTVAAVYASPLERARETAAPIARECHRAVRTEPGLIEIDVGEWSGASLARLRRRREWRVVQRYASGFRFPGGESFAEMQVRVVSTIDRLVDRHRGESIVAVSHADPIKAAVAYTLGTHLDLFQRIVIAPASISAITYRGEGPVVLMLNSMDGDLAALGAR
jgi:probable phosphomutase (TIGR03848 family)